MNTYQLSNLWKLFTLDTADFEGLGTVVGFIFLIIYKNKIYQ
jgi:hypothetical protein